MDEEVVGFGAAFSCRQIASGSMPMERVKLVFPRISTLFESEEDFAAWVGSRVNTDAAAVARQLWQQGKVFQFSMLGIPPATFAEMLGKNKDQWIPFDRFQGGFGGQGTGSS